MAHPKRRHSRSRRDKRRTHDKLKKPEFGICSQCKKAKTMHRVCPHCGFYKGKQVIEIKPKKKKQKR